MFKSILERLKLKKNPVKYWRSRGVTIGENCEIYSTATFGSEPYLIKLGDNVRINSCVPLITHDGGVWVLRNKKDEYKNIDMFAPIEVGNNVHIGSNAIIMPGVRIGSNCIIGCGAIVTKSIPDNSIAVGIPARVIENIDEYESKHIMDFVETKHLTSDAKKKYLMEKYASGNNDGK